MYRTALSFWETSQGSLCAATLARQSPLIGYRCCRPQTTYFQTNPVHFRTF